MRRQPRRRPQTRYEHVRSSREQPTDSAVVPQLLFSAIVPSSLATPLNPFLPPAAFLAALPSFTRQPARPASTLWRSTTGLLRAIRTARRRLVEGPLAGAGGEGKAQLPKYVVVISATDVENMGGDEVWLEDDDQGETWESFAKTFTRVRRIFPACFRVRRQYLRVLSLRRVNTVHRCSR